MGKVTVWTRQSVKILDDLQDNGRYVVKQSYIREKMEEHADLVLDVYGWYRRRAAAFCRIPDDVKYPIWVAVSESSLLGLCEEHVMLELSVDEQDLIIIDPYKWDLVINYMYLPKDAADYQRHQDLLHNYQTNDGKAYMTPFFPMIKREIVQSWDRLFEDNPADLKDKNGTLWEIRADWITKITHFADLNSEPAV